MTARKTSDTVFYVYRGVEKIYEHSLPSMRMSSQEVDLFLRVLYARFAALDENEFTRMFVNARWGLPKQHERFSCHTAIDAERETINRWCGNERCMSIAVGKVGRQVIAFVERTGKENQGQIRMPINILTPALAPTMENGNLPKWPVHGEQSTERPQAVAGK